MRTCADTPMRPHRGRGGGASAYHLARSGAAPPGAGQNEPMRAEEVIATHPDVAECAVIGVADALKGQLPVGFVVLKAGVDDAPADVAKEVVQMVRDRIGPVAAFKSATVVKRLPKTRSGKILRGTMQKIADNEPWRMPATIDDPAILGEIDAVFHGRHAMPRGDEAMRVSLETFAQGITPAEEFRIPDDCGLAGHVFQSRQALLIHDTFENDLFGNSDQNYTNGARLSYVTPRNDMPWIGRAANFDRAFVCR